MGIADALHITEKENLVKDEYENSAFQNFPVIPNVFWKPQILIR